MRHITARGPWRLPAGAGQQDRDRLRHDEQVQPRGQTGQIVAVQSQLERRLIDAGDVPLIDLGPAGNARQDDVAVVIARQAGGIEGGKGLASGRGPIQLISPRMMFSTCGSSSIRYRRRPWPTGVIRLSSCPAPLSAPTLMVRNLNIQNGRPCRPTRA
nr:hypothetical protein [Brevundimonas sp.]